MVPSRVTPLARVSAAPVLFAVVLLLAAMLTTGSARAATWSPSWTAYLPTIPQAESEFDHATTLPDGSVVVVGGLPQTNGGSKALVAKYDCKGNLVWKQAWSPDKNQSMSFSWVGHDDKGNIYTLARWYDPVSGSPGAVLAKYSAYGERLWLKNPIQPAGVSFGPQTFAVDGAGDSFLAGTTTGTSGNQAWLVLDR